MRMLCLVPTRSSDLTPTTRSRCIEELRQSLGQSTPVWRTIVRQLKTLRKWTVKKNAFRTRYSVSKPRQSSTDNANDRPTAICSLLNQIRISSNQSLVLQKRPKSLKCLWRSIWRKNFQSNPRLLSLLKTRRSMQKCRKLTTRLPS